MSSILNISLIPDTRTMKNSSRLEANTERNFNFSSAGVDLSVASSSTRLKNSNWHKSRLSTDQERKRFGFDFDSDCIYSFILKRFPAKAPSHNTELNFL